MVAIPFPLSSAPGRVPQEGAGRLLNCFAEARGDSRPVWARCPGLSLFTTSTQTGFRGALLVAGTLYAAWDGKACSYDSTGAETVIANMTGSAKGFWARNNNASPDIVFVDPNEGAFTVTSGSVVNFVDADLPQPNSVCFQHGYLFFTIGDGRVFSTDLNAVTVNSLNFTTAEAKPDGALRGIPFNDQLFVFGSSSIEVYQDTANATAFPYSHVTTIWRGLAGRYAVAGHEDGFGSGLLWVGDHNRVCMLKGYQPEDVSPPDLDRKIAAVADKDALEATVYISGGHPKWVLSCADWTWEFDLTTEKWNERASYQIARWRGTQAVYAFDKWLVGDTTSGKLLYVDDTAHDEDGDTLLYRIESAPVAKFPNRTIIARADFNFSTGAGIATGIDPIQTRPSVQVSWSDNGGVDWSNPLLRELGPQSRADYRITVTRTGMAGPQGRRWRLDVSDPVHIGLMGGDQHTELRAS